MIAPFRYRLGIELSARTVRAVLAEPAQGPCKLVAAVECDHSDYPPNSIETTSCLLAAAVRSLPAAAGETTVASLVLPADTTVESSVKVPKGVRIQREDWELWELSIRLPDPPSSYWYESSHAKDSICGRFSMRRVFAVRKKVVAGILGAAASLNLFIDRLLFPQSVWAEIVVNFGLADDCTRLDFAYVGERSACFLRMSNSSITEISPLQLPADGDSRRFLETVATLLSWHSGGPVPKARRILIDGGGEEEIVRAMTSRLGFSIFDIGPLSKRLHGMIDRPERFLLPLGALGVI